MKPGRGRTIAVAGGAALSAAMLLGGLGYRQELRERWYLWKLGSEDQGEKPYAAGKLGGLLSVRAVARLLPEEPGDILDALATCDDHLRSSYLESSEVAWYLGLQPVISYVHGARDSPEVGLEARVLRLSRMLEDPRERMRTFVAFLLGQMGPRAGPAVPRLAAALRDPDRTTRIFAVKSLGRIGPASEPAVPLLIDLLHSKDRVFRDFSARALGEIGPSAREAVPELLELTWDEDEALRGIAAEALDRIMAASGAGSP